MTSPGTGDQRPGISAIEHAEEALRRFDRETQDWERRTLHPRADDIMSYAEIALWLQIALLVALITGAAWLAVDITAQLPRAH